MKNRNLIFKSLLGALVVLGVIIFILLLSRSELVSSPKAVLGDKSFTVAIADESSEQMRGLSGKEKLQKDRGMLFLFEEEALHSFWMREMKFPLDIIFIRDNEIVKIYQNVPAPKDSESLPIYQSPVPTDKVLEINAGLSKKYGFREGQEVKFENL